MIPNAPSSAQFAQSTHLSRGAPVAAAHAHVGRRGPSPSFGDFIRAAKKEPKPAANFDGGTRNTKMQEERIEKQPHDTHVLTPNAVTNKHSSEKDLSERNEDRQAKSDLTDDALDPIARHASQLGYSGGLPLAPLSAHAVNAAPSVSSPASNVAFEQMLSTLVRRVAWSGDGRKGAVRMEIGSGALSGATLLIQSNDGAVRVRIDAPPGVDLEQWRDRLHARLTARGLTVEDVEVK